VLTQTDDIDLISRLELKLQKAYGYRVDEIPYNKLKFNNMNINITEMTTTFPCPVNKLKGQLMDNKGMSWETDHGKCILTPMSIEWIMQNVKTSQYTQDRCYIYNKAFARWFDNNNAYSNMFDNAKQMNEVEAKRNGTLTGGLAPTGVRQQSYRAIAHFDLIREWANERGLYDKGDPKTQTLKLIEEAGEICRAILKKDTPEIIDGIGDCVVVLTNLAELIGEPIENCIEKAYNEIKNRKGKMINGTFKKD
jgi:NTP pyrophosphatase (non-canonical NTP hydrolase)